jgi:hypothetical protein
MRREQEKTCPSFFARQIVEETCILSSQALGGGGCRIFTSDGFSIR